jgi:ribosome-associated protein
MSEKPSRTQKKKEAEALQDYGVKLVKLRDDQINAIALPEEILQAVRFAKTLQHGALRRQLQYIGTLMRKHNVASIQEILDNTEASNRKISRSTKEVERWRDRLLAGSDDVIKDIAGKCPDADPQYVAELVRMAGAEKEAGRPPRSARILFRYLKNIRNEDTNGPMKHP